VTQREVERLRLGTVPPGLKVCRPIRRQLHHPRRKHHPQRIHIEGIGIQFQPTVAMRRHANRDPIAPVLARHIVQLKRIITKAL